MRTRHAGVAGAASHEHGIDDIAYSLGRCSSRARWCNNNYPAALLRHAHPG